MWEQNYNSVNIQANKIDNDLWDLNFDQKNLKGQCKYQISKHFLSGKVERLYLTKSSWSHDVLQTAHLKPLDLPNLDLRIAQLKINQIDIGSVAIESTSTVSAGSFANLEYLITYQHQFFLQFLDLNA